MTPPSATLPASRSAHAAEVLLNVALAAHKAGSLGELLLARRRLAEWVSRRYLVPIFGAAGESLADESPRTEAIQLLLRWAILHTRPDQAPAFAEIGRQCWLERTSWRPVLALLCHYGFEAVPDFSDRYRRRPDESPVDNLCGLWNVGPSTFYRYLDKGKRLLGDSFAGRRLSGEQVLSLRDAALAAVTRRTGEGGPSISPEWHHAQVDRAIARRDPASALWHALRGGDASGFVAIVRRFRVELAADSEAHLLIARLATRALATRDEFDLLLAQAALWRSVGDERRERQAYDRAVGLGSQAGDSLLLGLVYGELGKFHEARDTDKALACFEDSAEFLRKAAEAQGGTSAEIHVAYVGALQKLGWAYVLRNDPRCSVVLERADLLATATAVPDETRALLEQTWGEYWRRTGMLQKAISHKHRALNIFERLADTRQILSTYNNLSLLYGEAKDHERSMSYARRVLDLATTMPVEPYILTNTYLNLGIAHFWQSNYLAAIENYRHALQIAVDSRLPVNANRAHYNLAEACYKQFVVSRDPEHERLGDHHAACALRAQAAESDSFLAEAARKLKSEILDAETALVHERMLSGDGSAHPAELAEVRQQRAILAVPSEPQAHIRAHLAIANAYLAISTKEREAALALIRQHGLGKEFDAEIDALQLTFSRELTREKLLQAQWKQKSYGVLTEERANAVLHQVLEAGSINKSGYAQLCQVGLATASKHLGTLAERGLLVQMGKGPSTRYVLAHD